MPHDQRSGNRAGVLTATGVVVVLLVVAMTVGRVSARGTPPRGATPAPSVFDILRPSGIAGVRFGASATAIRKTIDALVGQPGGAYLAGSCDVNQEIIWWDQRPGSGAPRIASGEPALIVYLRGSSFAGYQFGDPDPAVGPRQPAGGWTLATTRGLRVGDTLARGRLLYGRGFAISTAQGGSWSVRLTGGLLAGYSWGAAKDGGVSLKSVVATIDAGDVGCAAVTP